MINNLYKNLHDEGLLSDESLHKIEKQQAKRLLSIFWEFKTVLYLGVLLLSSGLGILIYKNIDTIGHQFILALIAAISIGCLWYCEKRKFPFSNQKVQAPDTGFDYILLLGVLMVLVFIGYLQFQYEVFGNRYGMATFIPMVILFFCAYYFDHIGILSMAIANLAIWMGVAVTPKALLAQLNFSNERFIYMYSLLGMLLLAAGYLSNRYQVKKHFSFSYDHYGIHVTYIALLSGFFHYPYAWAILWIPPLGLLSWYIYQSAYRARSLYFMLLAVLYTYIGVSGVVVRSLLLTNNSDIIQLILIYFIVSGIGLIFQVISLNKKIKSLKDQKQHVDI